MRVFVNGFGRIGRSVLRAWAQGAAPGLEIVGINDIAAPEMCAYLFEYDSTFGPWRGTVALNYQRGEWEATMQARYIGDMVWDKTRVLGVGTDGFAVPALVRQPARASVASIRVSVVCFVVFVIVLGSFSLFLVFSGGKGLGQAAQEHDQGLRVGGAEHGHEISTKRLTLLPERLLEPLSLLGQRDQTGAAIGGVCLALDQCFFLQQEQHRPKRVLIAGNPLSKPPLGERARL